MIIDPKIKCPKCGYSIKDDFGKDLFADGIVHISADDDILYIQCIHCGHYILSLNLQQYLKENWTCYCNICKCKDKGE